MRRALIGKRLKHKRISRQVTLRWVGLIQKAPIRKWIGAFSYIRCGYNASRANDPHWSDSWFTYLLADPESHHDSLLGWPTLRALY